MSRIDQNDVRWYQRAVFYEVVVRGFKDSNGDGTGDLPGLIDKLDYLEWLGIDCIWLLPFYKSPLRDGGYDICDFFTIHPELRRPRRRGPPRRGGARQGHPDHRRPGDEPHQRPASVVPGVALRPRQAHGRLVRVVRQTTSPTPTPASSSSTPSRRTGPMTTPAGQFYWHRFFHHQPDLNYDNPEVCNAMIDVVKFWLDIGLDGFRLDAVPYLFERTGTNGENLPETHEFLQRLRSEVDARVPGTGAPGRGQPVAGRRHRVLRFRGRRVPHGVPLPADAAHVHGGPHGDTRYADHGDPGSRRRRCPTAASGASSCATTTS